MEDTKEAFEEATASRRLDPELRVIGAIVRLLEETQPDARTRAVDYLNDRYRMTELKREVRAVREDRARRQSPRADARVGDAQSSDLFA